MGDYYGGYIFFPTIPDRQVLLQLVLDVIGVSPTDTQAVEEIWLYDGEDTNPSDLPREQALVELARTERGAMFVQTRDLEDAAFWFEPPVDGYHTVKVWGYDMGLVNRADRDNLGRVNGFVERWVSLCEQGQADFGFFGKYLQTTEPTYRDAVLPALLKNDVEALMREKATYWLIYLGPNLAEHWHTLREEIQAYDVQHLPSGALFVRTSEYLYD